MDYCDNNTRTALFSNINLKGAEIAPTLYKYLCPPLFFICFISLVLNKILFVIGHLKTRNKSPVLLLSLNLASTDALASLLSGIGLVFNSYLPMVYDIHFDRCPFLAFEITRMSAMIASVLHLLALAFIHYKGITKPLHYSQMHFCRLRVFNLREQVVKEQ
ncbi:Trace amine-associated receptor 2-like protein [Dinothrombium tinctorium]|uniref:Trace amine-associated receptor 2-like protein n=1 Tax=Dinothrombium tinctorium TaxID=1965070 RepID=A0A3S3PTU8_9ACAR|nr:Trace amine-associated receptor 2-like protein [Dinothrombium tinctorium]RWS16238.1 Trace amine-associated receptor 2-like protein [Dinothrombium tinctorium]